MYVLGGPSELMPEEGLNKVQRRQLAMLEHAERQKARDAEVARLQMESVLGRGEVTWGMAGDDAEQDAAAANDRAQVRARWHGRVHDAVHFGWPCLLEGSVYGMFMLVVAAYTVHSCRCASEQHVI